MGLYTFKQVPSNELEKLQEFLNVHWKKGHTLAISKKLMDFQHYNREDDSYNFKVAENSETKEYDAIVGYIPIAQYDKNLAENGDYWGAIWKIREDVTNSEINAAGFFLWKSLFKLPNFQSYAAVGISEIAKQIYVASRMTISHLSHYYMLNNETKEFKVAANVTSELKTAVLNEGKLATVKWIDINSINEGEVTPVYRPMKSLQYFKHRYENHPFYKYEFLGIFIGNVLKSILAVRQINVENSAILRVVDVLGELCGNCYVSMQNILHERNAEYIDFLNYGIEEDVFHTLGFRNLDFDGDLIIPNYMEPFTKCNVKINLVYKAKYDGYVAFKGDSDQDRPNIL